MLQALTRNGIKGILDYTWNKKLTKMYIQKYQQHKCKKKKTLCHSEYKCIIIKLIHLRDRLEFM